MIFNGKEKEYLTVLRGRNRPAWSPISRELVTVPNMAGAHLSNSQVQVRQIDVPVFIMAESFPDLQKLKEDVATWLVHDEPKELIFKDEPDRVYYAVVDGGLNLEELVRWGEGVITFICPDPYKYGGEETVKLTEDTTIIENKGTATAKPIIELTAKKKSTFAMVTLGENEYNLIGEPADDEVEVVDTRTPVLYENGSTLDTWDVATLDMLDKTRMPKIDGEMTSDDAGIRARNYGTGDKLHGPAVFKEIDPIQNFEIETTFDINSRRERESWRMGINFLDENLNILGHIGIKDNNRAHKRRVPLGRFGPYRGGGEANGNLIGDKDGFNNARDLTLFYLRVKREGNRFDFYIGEWKGHRHVKSWHEVYHDVNNQYAGKLKYITLYVSSFSDRVTPSRMRINSVEVFELSQVIEDQTPYIIYPGDVITFDHVDDDLLINGEARNDLKNFGGSFFEIKRGMNRVAVVPENTFDANLRFKERWR